MLELNSLDSSDEDEVADLLTTKSPLVQKRVKSKWAIDQYDAETAQKIKKLRLEQLELERLISIEEDI